MSDEFREAVFDAVEDAVAGGADLGEIDDTLEDAKETVDEIRAIREARR